MPFMLPMPSVAGAVGSLAQTQVSISWIACGVLAHAWPARGGHGYRAYTLVDHVADKVAAMYELHGAIAVPSTRYRDLVDLVAVVISVSVPARARSSRFAPKNRAGKSNSRSSRGPRPASLGDRLCRPGATVAATDRTYARRCP